MKSDLDQRLRQCRQRARLLGQMHPRNNPTPQDIAQFHLLHAIHEDEAGRTTNAATARERAARVLHLASKRA